MNIVHEFLNDNNVIKVAIRADASNRIGTGHVMRCLTLATTLKTYGIQVIFLSKNHSGNLNDFIRAQGFELFALSAPKQQVEDQTNDKLWLGCNYQDDVNECVDALSNTKIDMLIVDHYSLNYQWQSLIKTKLKQSALIKLMVIDDLANRKHDCDLLLDQTLGREILDYKELIPNHCHLLLGSHYIMLRDEFVINRQAAKNKRSQYSKDSENKTNILISMGGTDTDNISEKLLNWLITYKQVNNKIYATVIANQTSPYLTNLTAIRDQHSWISIIKNPDSMAKLMLDADIAIGSSGSTAWERCCLGLPSLSIISASNQVFLNENLTKTGAIINLGHFSALTYEKLEKPLSKLINDKNEYKTLVKNSLLCCDGLGRNRVTNILLANVHQNVFLKEASFNDCRTMFDWQSNSDVRKYSHNPEPVEWENHCDWLKSTLADKGKHLYIITAKIPEHEGLHSIGILRLDNLASLNNSIYENHAAWRISILVAPEYQGKKFGEKAIAKIPKNFIEQGIIAEVHSDNMASHRLFLKAGFSNISPVAYCLKSKEIK